MKSKGKTAWLAKPRSTSPAPHKWTLFFSVVATLVAIGSLMISWANFGQIERINRSHIKPDVMCVVRHNTLPQFTNAPYAAELVVLNKGPIKAAAVYVDYKVFVVDTNLWWPFTSVGIQESLHENYSFVMPELDVGEGKVKSILSAGPTAIYEIELSYYHPNDMTKFSEKLLYFYQSGQFYDQIGFQQKDFYPILMRNLEARRTDKRGELPPGVSLPPPDQRMPSSLLYVPEDNEVTRPLK